MGKSISELMDEMKNRRSGNGNLYSGDTGTGLGTDGGTSYTVSKPNLLPGSKQIDNSIPATVTDIEPELRIVRQRIYRLTESLEQQLPGYATVLHTIHKQLSTQAELTHLLTPEEVGQTIRAMKHRKNVILVEEKQKKSAGKKLKDTSLDDIS